MSSANHYSSKLERINHLDGWRGLAILLVLQAHFFSIPDFHSGRLGVDIFFCLSGLLMSKILFMRRVPLEIFYKRRITRIIPSCVLFVVVIYALAVIWSNVPAWPKVISTMVFLRAYAPADVHMFFYDGYSIGYL